MERDEKKLRRYLIGDLSESEQLTLEAEYLSNDDSFEQLSEIENDLVDEYVRGELTEPEHQLFEKNYLITPRHRQRVLLSQNLLRAASSISAPVDNTKAATASSWLTGLFSSFKIHQLAWAMMACFIAILCGWFLLRKPVVMTPEIAQVNPTPQIIFPSPSVEPSATKPEKHPSITAPPNSEIQNQKTIPAFMLEGAFDIHQTRGASGKGRKTKQSRQVIIEKNIEKISLQMKLEGERFAKYQAEIRVMDSNKTFTLTMNSPAKSAQNIHLTIPVNRFVTADYVLTLSGVTSAGEVEEINQYPFRVTRK